MEIDHDAKVKFFLVMPYTHGASDMEGALTQPLPENYEIWFTLEAAEKALLRKQKEDSSAVYLILESRFVTAKHNNLNEYCIIDTVPW